MWQLYSRKSSFLFIYLFIYLPLPLHYFDLRRLDIIDHNRLHIYPLCGIF